MPARRFFIALAVMLVVLTGFNVFLALRVDSVPKLIMRNMRAEPKIDVLFLGNSLMQSGLDTPTFEAALPAGMQLKAFNAGLGSSSPVEHYLLAREAYRHHDTIPHIVYGFYDLQMTQSPGYSWADLVGNRSMVYSTEPELAAALYAPDAPWQKWRFDLIGAVPMLRDHSQLWKYVEVLRRKMEDVGMPKTEVNEFGRVADFEKVAAPDREKIARDCEATVKVQAPFITAVQALIEMAHDKKADLIVVEMPMTADHRAAYYATPAWQQYRAYVQQKLKAEGVRYVIASDWITDDKQFSDGLHLNSDGAKVFSTKIAQALGQP